VFTDAAAAVVSLNEAGRTMINGLRGRQPGNPADLPDRIQGDDPQRPFHEKRRMHFDESARWHFLLRIAVLRGSV